MWWDLLSISMKRISMKLNFTPVYNRSSLSAILCASFFMVIDISSIFFQQQSGFFIIWLDWYHNAGPVWKIQQNLLQTRHNLAMRPNTTLCKLLVHPKEKPEKWVSIDIVLWYPLHQLRQAYLLCWWNMPSSSITCTKIQHTGMIESSFGPFCISILFFDLLKSQI